MPHTPDSLAKTLIGDTALCAADLFLQPGECRMRIRSNSPELLDQLRHYFAHVLADSGEADIEVVAIEREEPQTGVEFSDWKREPGKTGRKDSYADFADARLVRKVRTGMLFLQSRFHRVAAGACLQHDNQVINFINAQYMNWLQQRGWLICHASGLVRNGRTLGMAGFSGGGKSTLMLQLLERPGIRYLTNDRLFIRRDDGQVMAAGIPKLPRVNPGTIVHNPRLHPLIAAGERQRLLDLPQQELWDLEDKYDVMIDELYGPGQIAQDAPLGAFLVLNWQRDSDAPLHLQQVDIAQRPELLGAIMKSPGPFLQYPDGSFLMDDTPLEERPYLETLAGIPVYEACGGVDFEALQQCLLQELPA
jgi:HprK-related kinase B